MKKRVKLLTTIASLCLAVALMAFGVYAANQATLTLGSTVAFNSDNVAVGYTVNVAWADSVTRSGDVVTATTGVTVSDTYQAGQAGTLNVTAGQELQAADDANYNWALGDYEFGAATVAVDDTIVYTVTIKNNATNSVTVVLTSGVTAGTYGGITVEVSGDFTSGSAVLDTKDAEATYTVTYKVNDIAIDATDTLPEFNPVFTTKETVA